jgi:hypothetical protein
MRISNIRPSLDSNIGKEANKLLVELCISSISLLNRL